MLLQPAFSVMRIFSRLRPKSRPDIVFVGDSITQQGGDSGGYVDLIKQSYPDRTIAYYGLSGGRAADLWTGKCAWSQTIAYADILKTAPMILVLYIGVNDIWHQPPTAPEVFRSHLIGLVNQAKVADAIVILVTPAVIGENLKENPKSTMLDEFGQIVREVADAQQSVFCNLRQAFMDYLKMHNPADRDSGVLTTDGVHLNGAGNRLVADCIRRSLLEVRIDRTSQQ
jgi:lysophospholipase L1-like esterase